ncbi:hypothetical protein RFI_24900 [Reticulomyxa filosa]|uniref:Uncharacterized protein n=1 Tax=Reticulomyxa filosa TaxID=46433 RepID=X6MFP7_RETFI|nr:hypothetical protein RFI_24900 [Reticulomyxa filosa]|eukprot:ETO12476.1 hypothetical protein RFI_24900 [Reticulomyxa filosa]
MQLSFFILFFFSKKKKCESDERTKKGYQMQKEEIEKQIREVDNDVKELELQQQSDVSTIQFLQQQISTKEQQIEDLAKIPERLKQEEAQREAEFQQKIKELEDDSNNSFQEQLIKINKEKDILTKEIKVCFFVCLHGGKKLLEGSKASIYTVRLNRLNKQNFNRLHNPGMN